MKRAKSSWLLVAMPCLALAGVIWIGFNNKFPYVGAWRDRYYAVEFDKLGRCRVWTVDEHKKPRAIPASYSMQGRSAIITWGESYPLRTGGTGESRHIERVTPQQEGVVLQLTGVESRYFNHATGKVIYGINGTIYLRKQ